jgi:hypothetical protein
MTDLDGSHYFWEKGIPNYILNKPLDRSVGPHLVSLSVSTKELVGLSQASIDSMLLGLPDPYLRYAINMFNTCSRGPTHRSLTNTCGGHNLGGVSFPYHTPQPSQPTVLRFPPKGPARSQVIQSQHKPLEKWCETPITNPWSFDHSASTEFYNYA